jgi:hypothetical protein
LPAAVNTAYFGKGRGVLADNADAFSHVTGLPSRPVLGDDGVPLG